VEPELQYADFAAWQRETLDDARLSPALAYWQNRLKNAVPPPSFPHHHRPLPADTVPGAGLRFSWAGNLLKELREYVQPAGMSLFIPLLATYKALLFLYTGEPGILVCSPVASRTRVELEKMPGCFVNLLPLGSALSLTAGFQEALERVRETCLEAYQHQEYPFEQLLEKVLPPAEEGAYTRYMFELTNTPTRSQLNLPGLVVQPLLLERGTARHDLQLIFEERGDKLAGWLVYKTALFTPENARQILQDYRSLLETGLKNPHASLERLAELAGIRRSR
jgi:non-ribosomal peptide synthetase component F